jgi:four helix bundle protein
VYDQLTRAAISAQLNISEGYGTGTRGLFLHHLRIARGSAIETGDLLELLLELGAVPSSEGSAALRSCLRCQRLLLGLVKKYQAPESGSRQGRR